MNPCLNIVSFRNWLHDWNEKVILMILVLVFNRVAHC